MPKKRSTKKNNSKKEKDYSHIPYFSVNRTFGRKAADFLTRWVGSWKFIISLAILMTIWMILNIVMLIKHWDPYPFILLNFVLSTLAAIQAPIILMSQNRQAERDRLTTHYDYKINTKAEKEIQNVQRQLREIKQLIKDRRRH